MNTFDKCKNLSVISLIIIGLLFSSGCLIHGDRYYFPKIYAQFDTSLNIFSLCDVMIENNVSCSIGENKDDTAHRPILSVNWPDNTTYIFSNNSYNISATRGSIVDDSDAPTPYLWMNLFLEDIPQYRYPSEKEAHNATYLLEPSFDLIKYFLNESSNPMPYKVRYKVEYRLID